MKDKHPPNTVSKVVGVQFRWL